MSGFFSRILSYLKSAAEDAVDASVDADEIAYKHLLWLMQQEAGSSTDAWAGQAHSEELAEKYGTVAALLDAKPELARYRAPDNGEGPLFWAAFYGPLSVAQRLVSMGADPKSTTTKSVLIWYNPGGMQSINRGCTTLMMAAAGGHPEIVRYLLDQGVPANAVALDGDHHEKGDTAVYLAARDLGTAEIIRMLVAAGADPNLGEEIGFTPAGAAAERGAGEVLEALIEAGADLSVPSGSKSVMELAAAAGDSAALRPLVLASFGRILTLEDVTGALQGAGIAHEVVPRSQAKEHDADLVCYMAVYGKIMDENHHDLEGTPDFYVWGRRNWDEIQAIDLEEKLEDMNIGSRRFADDGEMKAVLGIAEGGLTPFAKANDRADRVVFESCAGGGDGKVALEAFDAERVVVLLAGDVNRAISAFSEAVGPPPRTS